MISHFQVDTIKLSVVSAIEYAKVLLFKNQLYCINSHNSLTHLKVKLHEQ